MLKEGKISYEKFWMLCKKKGLTTTRIRKEKIISESALQLLRTNDYVGGNISTDTIAALCAALECQPGDIMEYVPNDVLKERGFLVEQEKEEISKPPGSDLFLS